MDIWAMDYRCIAITLLYTYMYGPWSVDPVWPWSIDIGPWSIDIWINGGIVYGYIGHGP